MPLTSLLLPFALTLFAPPPPPNQSFAFSSVLDSRGGAPKANVELFLSPVQGLGTIVSVRAGGRHSIALKSDGTVWTWGENRHKQLGQGDRTFANSFVPLQVTGLPPIVQVEAGEVSSYALTSTGDVYGWGWNGPTCDLSFPPTVTRKASPEKIPGLSRVVQIQTTGAGALALRDDGTVVGWGYNQYGQLAQGGVSYSLGVVQVPGIDRVTKLVCQGATAFALRSDGSVWGWGSNWLGRLGAGIEGPDSTSAVTSPVPILGLSDTVELSSSNTQTVALRADGKVLTWGINERGELGDSTVPTGIVCESIPKIRPELSMTGVRDVFAGNNSTVICLNDGTAWVVGNTHDLLTVPQTRTPIQIPNAYNIVEGSCLSGFWMLRSKTTQPIWSEIVAGDSAVPGYRAKRIRVHTEQFSEYPIPFELSSSDPLAIIVATGEIPAGAAFVEIPVELPGTTDVDTSVLLQAATTQIRAANLLKLKHERAVPTFDRNLIDGDGRGTLTVTLNFPAPRAGMPVVLTSSNPTRLLLPASITIPSGKMEASVSFETVPAATNYDVLARATVRSFSADASATVRGNPIKQISISPTEMYGVARGTLRVDLSEPAPPGGLNIRLQGSRALRFPDHLRFAEGEVSRTVGVLADRVVVPVSVTVYADIYPNETRTATVNIRPAELVTLKANPSKFRGAATGKVTLVYDGTLAYYRVLTLKSSSPLVQVPKTVLVDQDSRSKTIEFTVREASGPKQVTLTAQDGDRVVTSRVELGPVLPGLVSVSIPKQIVGGSPATGTLNFSGPMPNGGAWVQLDSSDASCVVPPAVFIGRGKSSASFTATTSSVTAPIRVVITAHLGSKKKMAGIVVK